MKEWSIPVTWTVCGKVKVEADTLAEAMKIARDDDGVLPLPSESDYVDDSWVLSEEDVEVVRCLYNDGQTDAIQNEVPKFKRRFL